MHLLEEFFFGNTVLSWLVALGIFLATVGGGALARIIALKRLKPSTATRAFLIEAVRHTRYVFFIVLGVELAAGMLSIPASARHSLHLVTAVVVLVQIAWWGHGIVDFWVKRVTRRRAEHDLGSVTTIRALGIVVKLVLWSILFLAVLGTVGIDVTTVVAGLGIGGIAIALAVQNIMGDLFASVSIILDKPFLVGDFIKVGEQLGTVQNIGVKTTRLQSLSGEQLIFGNADLLRSRIQNFKRMSERRIVFTIGVEYSTSRESVKAIPGMIRAAIQAQPKTRTDRVHFKEYSDSALIFEAVYFVLSPDYNIYMDTQQAINVRIFEDFAESKIGFAFPTRTVMLRMDAGEAESLGETMARREGAGAEERETASTYAA